MPIFFAVIAAVTGLVYFILGIKRMNVAQVIEDTETSRTIDICDFGLYELKGVIKCDTTIDMPATSEPCVWYHFNIQQRVRTRGTIGRHRGSHTHWETVRDEEFGTPFIIKDQWGEFRVDPVKATVIAPDIPLGEKHEGVGGFIAEMIGSAFSGQKMSLQALTPGMEVYVLGEVQPGPTGNCIGCGYEKYPFIISYQKEEGLLASMKSKAILYMVFGGILILVAALIPILLR